MKKLIIVLFVIAVLVLGYLGITKVDKPTEKSPIKIGVIAPLTGIVASFGEEAKRGIEAAKASGVEIIYEDDQCDPKLAITAFKKLIELDRVNLIIGPACGSSQEVVAPLAKETKTILLLPSAASSRLFETSGGYVYNMQYSLEKESEFNALTMYDKGYKRVALITYPNAFSETHERAFRGTFKGEIVKTFKLPADGVVPSTEMLKLAKENIDAVYITDISFFFGEGIDKLKRAGITKPLFSTYVVELPIARTLVGNTTYSFPKDITDGKGGVYGLAKESLKQAIPLALSCGEDTVCMQKKLTATGLFDGNGVRMRDIVLKQIVNGEPVLLDK